jgi:hypothetical protein
MPTGTHARMHGVGKTAAKAAAVREVDHDGNRKEPTAIAPASADGHPSADLRRGATKPPELS